MLEFMRRIIVLVLFLFCFPPVVSAEPVRLTADQWSRPRAGAMIVQFPELNRAVERFERQPNGILLIRHDPADDGVLWAAELRSWLVALGIPSSRIRLQAQGGMPDHILVEAASDKSAP